MKRLGMRLLWAPVVLALLVFLGNHIEAQVRNGGFEKVVAGQFADWTVVPDSGIVKADKASKKGKTSARLLVPSIQRPTELMSAPVAVVSGKLYGLSGWTRLSDMGGTRRGFMRIRWLNDRLQSLAFAPSNSSSGTSNKWTPIAATVRAPDGAHFAQVICLVECRDDRDAPIEAWFDEVAFKPFDDVLAQMTLVADSLGEERKAQVRVSVRDTLGNPVTDGMAVRFSADRGDIDAWVATQNGDAVATLHYGSDLVGGAFVRAQAGSLSVSVLVGDMLAATLGGRVYDADSGTPLAARLVVTDSLGLVRDVHHPMQDVVAGRFVRFLTPGRVWITVDRGAEYIPPEPQAFTLIAGERVDVDLPLRSWAHMSDRGWQAGDLMVHAFGKDPRWDLVPEDAVQIARAAGLHFALFANGMFGQGLDQDALATDLQTYEFWPFAGRYVRTAWGQQWVLGGGDWAAIDRDAPGFVVHEQVRQGRGFVGYTNPFDTDRMAVELPFDALAGPSFDALDILSQDGGNQAQHLWFALLNRGLHVVGTASSQAMLDGTGSNAIGHVRTYVQVGGDVTAGKLRRALSDGQVVVSNGPLLQFSVFAAGPGSTLPIGRLRRATIRAWASGDLHDYLTRVELIRNAEVVQAWDLTDQPRKHRVSVSLSDSVACWYVARCYGKDSTRVAITNPIFFRDFDYVPPEHVQAIVRGTIQTVDGAPVSKAVVEVLNPLGNVVLQTAARGGTFQVWAPPTAHIRVTAEDFDGQTLRIFDDPNLQALLQGLRDAPPESLYADETYAQLVTHLHQIQQVFTLAPKR